MDTKYEDVQYKLQQVKSTNTHIKATHTTLCCHTTALVDILLWRVSVLLYSLV